MLKDKIVDLKAQLVNDADLVQEMISRSVRGLLERKPDLLNEVIETHEPTVNAYDVLIDELCVELIARYEPVASDLRMVIMVIKMNKDLERMADHAVNIAESSLLLISDPFSASYEDVRLMGEETVRMLKDSISAFVNLDVGLANAVCARDNVVDTAGDAILKRFTELMRTKKSAVTPGLQLMRIAHNLERIADLATNIAEEVIYIAEGRDIKHHHS